MMDKIKTAPSEASQFRMGSTDVELEEGASTFSMKPYKKGQVVEHFYWGAFVFETSSMKMRKDNIPALIDHDTAKLSGRIDAMDTSGDHVEFSGEFLDNDNAKYVKDGRGLMETSLRFDLDNTDAEYVVEGAEVEVDGFSHQGPLYVFRNAPIMESSFTLFGHVPDTVTSFVKQENNMADAPNTADVRASVQSDLSKMSAMCGDANFVLECFNKGMNIEQFSSELLGKQAEEIKSLTEKNEALELEVSEFKKKESSATSGASAVQFSSSENQAGESEEVEVKDFMGAISKFKKDGLGHREALVKASREFPELYKQHTGRA
jgi:hypothetical protein